jgi:hypothetical protein
VGREIAAERHGRIGVRGGKRPRWYAFGT